MTLKNKLCSFFAMRKGTHFYDEFGAGWWGGIPTHYRVEIKLNSPFDQVFNN